MKRGKSAGTLKGAMVLLACALVSCARLGAVPPVKSAETVRVPASFNLHYFFDRTESMRGFLVKGNNSDYVKAMKALWEVGAAMPDPHERIYDYGDAYTREYKEAAFSKVKDLVRSESFYGLKGSLPRSDANCDWVKNNNERPFYSVAEYIKTLDTNNADKNSAYIVVTDLYDLGTPNPFVRFFSDTFSRGQSGAIFAIESSFSGTIESISSTGDKTQNITVRDKDAKSTFFVCAAGDSAVVSAYSAALAKELQANNIVFHYAVFMASPGENIMPRVSKPVPVNKKEFDDSKNAVVSANIDTESLGKNIQSYRLLKFDSSRWAGGLPLSNINAGSFTYDQNSALYFSDDKANEWKPVDSKDSGNFSVKVRRGSNIPLYVVVETKNKALKKGYYRISYKIIPKANPAPAWVAQLNAPDIAALEESVQVSASSGTSVKVLQLANVWEKIADAYNKANQKGIYSGELYLIKR